MVELFFIENKKTVVGVFKDSYFNRRVLQIVFFKVEFELVAQGSFLFPPFEVTNCDFKELKSDSEI